MSKLDYQEELSMPVPVESIDMIEEAETLQNSFMLSETAQAHANPFFKDPRTNLIDEVFSRGKRLGIIHLEIDDAPHNGKTYSVDGKDYISFANCSYLGMEIHDQVKRGAINAIQRYGMSFNMSRAYGSNPMVAELEALLNRITEERTLLTLSTGRAHEAFISVMIQAGDVLILDQQVHTTVQVACAAAATKDAKVTVIPHNDMRSLERKVESLSKDPNVNNIWYLGDGLYSMFGDYAPVSEIVSLLDQFPKLHCYLDDAHGLSIRGQHGRGYVLSQRDRLHQKMIVALSLGKSFGMGQGGCLVVADEEWHRKIKVAGGSLIFGSPVAIPCLGAGIESAKVHLSSEISFLQKRLEDRIKYFNIVADELDVKTLSDPLSPIKYIPFGVVDLATAAAVELIDKGLHVSITSYPAVPKKNCGIRVTLTVHHTETEIRNLLEEVKSIQNKLKV